MFTAECAANHLMDVRKIDTLINCVHLLYLRLCTAPLSSDTDSSIVIQRLSICLELSKQSELVST